MLVLDRITAGGKLFILLSTIRVVVPGLWKAPTGAGGGPGIFMRQSMMWQNVHGLGCISREVEAVCHPIRSGPLCLGLRGMHMVRTAVTPPGTLRSIVPGPEMVPAGVVAVIPRSSRLCLDLSGTPLDENNSRKAVALQLSPNKIRL